MMLELGSSFRETDKMSLWEITAAIAYHNDRQIPEDKKPLSELEREEIAALEARAPDIVTI